MGPVQIAVKAADEIRTKTDYYGNALQLGHYAFRGVELFKATGPTTQILTQVAHSIAILDFLQIISDINYFISGACVEDWKKKKFCAIAASSVFPIATVSGITLWFIDLTILKGGLSLIPIIGNIAISAALIGHAFGAANAVQSIFQAENKAELTKAILDLISKLADVGVHVMLLVPIVSLPGVIVLGIVAKGVGLAGVLFVYVNDEAKKVNVESK